MGSWCSPQAKKEALANCVAKDLAISFPNSDDPCLDTALRKDRHSVHGDRSSCLSIEVVL